MKFFLILNFLITFISCTPKIGVSDDSKNTVYKLAQQKIGKEFVCVPNETESYLLCKSKVDSVLLKGPLIFFIFDLSNQEIIYEEKLSRGFVQWESATSIKVQTIPGINEEGKGQDDYTYEIDVREILRSNDP